MHAAPVQTCAWLTEALKSLLQGKQNLSPYSYFGVMYASCKSAFTAEAIRSSS